MRIRERLEAVALISDEFLATEGGMESVREQLGKQVIRTADLHAYKVRRESVVFWRGKHLDATGQTEYHAVWSPKEARLVGGEYDGDSINITCDGDGRPPQAITLPYRSSPQFSAELHPAPTANPTYRCDGIDPIDDVWVYVLV